MDTVSRTFALNFFFRRSDELPGQWVAHCLDVDVVTYGNSLRHALEMLREAVDLVVVEDLSTGLEPLERSAPREEWEAMIRCVNGAETRAYPLSELLEREETVRFAVVPVVVAYHRVDHREHMHQLGTPAQVFAEAA